jgi:ribonuclease HI
MKNNERKIIYSDASTSKEFGYKIGLYDPAKNKTKTLEIEEGTDTNIAEQYGVIYAILYCVKHNYKKAYILTDNKSAVENAQLIKLANEANCTISWIPREINEEADKISKSKPNQKMKDWYLLDYLFKLHVKSSILITNEKEDTTSIKITKEAISDNDLNILKKVVKKTTDNEWPPLGQVGKELKDKEFDYKKYNSTLGKLFESIEIFELFTDSKNPSLKKVKLKDEKSHIGNKS